jgi:hypothetical protein
MTDDKTWFEKWGTYDKQYLGHDKCDLLRLLREVEGGFDYSGDYSCQTCVPLSDGSQIRIGITDEDAAEIPGYWFDFYGGLAIKGYTPMNDLTKEYPEGPVKGNELILLSLLAKIKNSTVVGSLVSIPIKKHILNVGVDNKGLFIFVTNGVLNG